MLKTAKNQWLPIGYTFITWIAAPFVLSWVLDRNLAGGHYASDADSTAIPFAFAVEICILGLPYILLVSLLAAWRHQTPVDLFRFRMTWWDLVALIALAPIFLVTALQAAYWLAPYHYFAAFAYFLPIVGFVYLRAMIASQENGSHPSS